MFWFILYNGVLLPVLVFLVFSASIFLPKLKEGLKGRFQTYDRIKSFLKEKHTNNDIYWFHAASLKTLRRSQLFLRQARNWGRSWRGREVSTRFVSIENKYTECSDEIPRVTTCICGMFTCFNERITIQYTDPLFTAL